MEGRRKESDLRARPHLEPREHFILELVGEPSGRVGRGRSAWGPTWGAQREIRRWAKAHVTRQQALGLGSHQALSDCEGNQIADERVACTSGAEAPTMDLVRQADTHRKLANQLLQHVAAYFPRRVDLELVTRTPLLLATFGHRGTSG